MNDTPQVDADEPGAEAAAKDALDLVADLAADAEPVDPERLRLGPALRSFFIDPDLVERIANDRDVQDLLEGADGVIFPVEQGEQVVSSVTVKPGAGADGWRVDAVGGANLMRRISQIRDEDAAGASGGEPSYFVVEIPSFHLSLLGRVGADGWKLRQIHASPRLALGADAWSPAADVFDQVARLLPDQDS